jgi:hypothetical protein
MQLRAACARRFVVHPHHNKRKNIMSDFTSVNDAFPSKYLKASDLRGKEATETMDYVKTELIGMDNEPKAVLHFKGRQKGLVLNKTNARAISQLHGDDFRNWPGKPITIFACQVDFKGTPTMGLRVKAPAGVPNGAARAIEAQRPAYENSDRVNETAAAELDDNIPW